MNDRAASRRIAFFGGSFDPVHSGHIEIAKVLTKEFGLDVFVFVPAFHAPHKREFEPASPYHRFAMLALATDGMADIGISTIELEDPESPYTIETMEKVKVKFPETEIFFVIGADSWMDITTWRLWEDVLTSTNIIVVTRPGVEIGFSHVTDEIRERIVDLRGKRNVGAAGPVSAHDSADEDPDDSDRSLSIYITDSVNANVSATALRKSIRDDEDGWKKLVPESAARHIVKYGLYK
ncbi:MAG: nicotinate (nicotinamide) nucleotide adenylyltransferase [Acidobacteriota bacterium]|nr:MAG: nicotinate (nicotinamide) nucleotide adenylyltransferase [Acidobacteriota bacterium]